MNLITMLFTQMTVFCLCNIAYALWMIYKTRQQYVKTFTKGTCYFIEIKRWQ